MFKKVLVANRGDVAIRVMRACRELGVETVAIYSDADRNALHVRYADEAYLIGEGPARSSYLDIEGIIGMAVRSGADAIHPGYGFLSENAAFSRACDGAQITFIGASPQVMEALGDRQQLGERLEALGISVWPMIRRDLSAESLGRTADGMEYPLLVRPVVGGGGFGERLVLSPEELDDLISKASREAASSFGSGEVYLEKSLPGARRIEVHVLADSTEQVVYLGESEGTIRRRHQKLIEESPSPVVTPELRREMGKAACEVPRQIGFVGMGTVEFLLEENGRFHFLHFAPRLWVGHPVVEMVTGMDLVKEQIRVASGRKLRYRQADIVLRGHAIECRIHAEDPYDHFRPSVGQITRLMEPGGPGTRIETGVYEGFEVSYYYDPLISKAVVWGESRGEAIMRMRRVLNEYRIVGVKSNIPFLEQIMNRTSFIGGQFEASQEEAYFTVVKHVREELFKASAIAAALLAHQKWTRDIASFNLGRRASPWKVAGRWEEMGE